MGEFEHQNTPYPPTSPLLATPHPQLVVTYYEFLGWSYGSYHLLASSGPDIDVLSSNFFFRSPKPYFIIIYRPVCVYL